MAGSRFHSSSSITTTSSIWAAAAVSILEWCSVPEAEREILIVDNGSTDGAPAWARERFGVRVVRSDINLGFARAANLGIRSARGGFAP